MIDPVLSICIPTLNRAPFLKGCLAAITREPGCEKVEIIIVEGALKQILRRVESLSDVYISDVVFCNKNLKPHSRSRFLNANDGQVFDISKTQEYIEYIRSSSSNNALFCYMSNIIFKRSSWRFSNQGLTAR